MTKNEVKIQATSYLSEFMLVNGYNIKKVGYAPIFYSKETVVGRDEFDCDIMDRVDAFQLACGVSKKIKSIETITAEIDKLIKLNPKIDSNTESVITTPRRMYDLGNKDFTPQIQTEADVKLSVDMIIDFMQKDALPLLDRFNDLREIDKAINGDDFWFDDWQKEFNLGGNFTEKQFIIAKLVGGQKHLDEVIEKHKIAAKKYWAEQGKETNCPYLTNIETSTGFTIQYLKNVEPIY